MSRFGDFRGDNGWTDGQIDKPIILPLVHVRGVKIVTYKESHVVSHSVTK